MLEGAWVILIWNCLHLDSVCVCVYWGLICTCVLLCKGQRRISYVLLYHSPSYSLEAESLSLNLKQGWWGHQALVILVLPSLHGGLLTGLAATPTFLCGFRDLNSGPYACAAKILPL